MAQRLLNGTILQHRGTGETFRVTRNRASRSAGAVYTLQRTDHRVSATAFADEIGDAPCRYEVVREPAGAMPRPLYLRNRDARRAVRAAVAGKVVRLETRRGNPLRLFANSTRAWIAVAKGHDFALVTGGGSVLGRYETGRDELTALADKLAAWDCKIITLSN